MILLITAAIVAAVIIYGHPPGNNKWYPPCIFKKITSFDCPGCGSTRACYHVGCFYTSDAHRFYKFLYWETCKGMAKIKQAVYYFMYYSFFLAGQEYPSFSF